MVSPIKIMIHSRLTAEIAIPVGERVSARTSQGVSPMEWIAKCKHTKTGTESPVFTTARIPVDVKSLLSQSGRF